MELEELRKIATLYPKDRVVDGETVLALIARLEQAEQDRVKLRNRLDAMRRQRDGYQAQARKAEQAVARVREAMGKPWGSAITAKRIVRRALDGDTRG